MISSNKKKNSFAKSFNNIFFILKLFENNLNKFGNFLYKLKKNEFKV